MMSPEPNPRRGRLDSKAGSRRAAIVLGLAACAAIVLLSIASFRWAFGFVWDRATPTTQTVHTLGWSRGNVRWEAFGVPPGSPPVPLAWKTARANSGGLWSPAGVTVQVRFTLLIPFWFLLLPVAIPVALLVRIEHRASKRTLRGCCPECGYTLAGIPVVEGVKVCPECGRRRRRRGLGGSPSDAIG